MSGTISFQDQEIPFYASFFLFVLIQWVAWWSIRPTLWQKNKYSETNENNPQWCILAARSNFLGNHSNHKAMISFHVFVAGIGGQFCVNVFCVLKSCVVDINLLFMWRGYISQGPCQSAVKISIYSVLSWPISYHITGKRSVRFKSKYWVELEHRLLNF